MQRTIDISQEICNPPDTANNLLRPYMPRRCSGFPRLSTLCLGDACTALVSHGNRGGGRPEGVKERSPDEHQPRHVVRPTRVGAKFFEAYDILAHQASSISTKIIQETFFHHDGRSKLGVFDLISHPSRASSQLSLVERHCVAHDEPAHGQDTQEPMRARSTPYHREDRVVGVDLQECFCRWD